MPPICSPSARSPQRSGIAPSALRYYESEGLIDATRTTGNQRRYQRNVLRRLAFIRAAQNVGLSLEEIAARARHPARGAHADAGRLDAAVADLARSPRRADRRAAQAARRAGLVHRLRLPVAAALRRLRTRPTSRRAAGRARSISPAPLRVYPASAVDDLGARQVGERGGRAARSSTGAARCRSRRRRGRARRGRRAPATPPAARSG